MALRIPEGVPTEETIEPKRSEMADAISGLAMPGHATEFPAAVDNEVSGPFNRAGANRDALLG